MGKVRVAPWIAVLLCLSPVGIAAGARTMAAAPAPPPPAKKTEVLDPAAIRAHGPALASSVPLPPLAVVAWAPQGRLDRGVATASQQIRVRFNRPVVALGAREMLTAKELLTIEPPVAGATVWQSPELLVFTSDKPLPRSTAFKVTLRTPLVGLQGGRIERPHTWVFETARLVMNEQHDGRPLNPNQAIPLWFSQPVLPSVVKQATTVFVGDRQVPFEMEARRDADARRADQATHDVKLLPRTPWPVASKVVVAVSGALRGQEGPLPMGEAWARSFETAPIPAIKNVTCASGKLTVELNVALQDDERGFVEASPPLHFRLEQPGWAVSPLTAEAKPGATYSIRLLPSARSELGHAPADTSPQKITCELPGPGLALRDAGGVFAPVQPPLAGLAARWVRTVQVRTAVLDEKALASADLSLLKPRDHLPPGLAWHEQPIVLSPRGPTHFATAAIDLASVLKGRRLPVLVALAPLQTEKPLPALDARDNSGEAERRLPDIRAGIFQSTNFGATLVGSSAHSILHVVALDTAVPVAGAKVKLALDGKLRELGSTDAAGLLVTHWAPDDAATSDASALLLVTSPDGADLATLPVDSPYDFEIQARPRRTSQPRTQPQLRSAEHIVGQLVTDRDIYLPGESVRFVGWGAIASNFHDGGLRPVPAGTVAEIVLGDEGAPVVRVELKVSREGKIWGELPLPAQAKLGEYWLRASLRIDVETERSSNASWWHAVRTTMGQPETIRVKKFRTPEFFVEAHPHSESVMEGQSLSADLRARYHFGVPTPVVAAQARMSCSTFWADRRITEDDEWQVGIDQHDEDRAVFQQLPLDPAKARVGEVSASLRAKALARNQPTHCNVEVALRDASLREEGTSYGFAVHPSPVYLGLSYRYAPAGSPMTVKIRAFSTKRERTAWKGITLTLRKRNEAGILGRWQGDATQAGPDLRVTTPRLTRGEYELEAVASTGPGREVRTLVEVNVNRPSREDDAIKSGTTSGPSWPRLRMALERVGDDHVRVVIEGPPVDAHGFLVVETSGLPETWPFRLKAGRAELDLTIGDGWAPEVKIQALAFVPPDRGQSIQPLSDEQELEVEPTHRRLQVSLHMAEKARPGDNVTVTALATDRDGKPVAGRVSFWAVDLAVLSLTEYRPADPLPALLPSRDSYSWWRYSLVDDLLPGWKPELQDPMGPLTRPGRHGFGLSSTGSGGGGTGEGEPDFEINRRTKFEITPLFVGDAPVGADGKATVSFKLPHNLTTYRVTAIASASGFASGVPTRFGTADAKVTVGLPLQVRPALPRNLRPGDEAEVAVLVDNLAGPAGRIEVRATVLPDGKAAPLVLAQSTARAEIAERAQQKLDFKLKAASTGIARLRFDVVLRPSGKGAPVTDGIEVELPVAAEPPLLERVAVHGTSTDDTALAVPVRLPAGIARNEGSLDLALASTLVDSLDGAVADLLAYPHRCLEQTASRLVPLLVLPETARRHLPAGESVEATIQQGIQQLLALRIGGGFSYWPRTSFESRPSDLSPYAILVLAMAAKSGYRALLPSEGENLDYDAATELRHTIRDLGDPPRQKPADEKLAFALLAATETRGVRRHEESKDVTKEIAERSAEAAKLLGVAWPRLSPAGKAVFVLATAKLNAKDPQLATRATELASQLRELGGTAHAAALPGWTSSIVFSDTTVDALTLWALVRAAPANPTIPKLVRGLLEARSGPSWRSTQENAFALLALTEYAKRFEAETPAFTVTSWLGSTQNADAHFVGRHEKPRVFSWPLTDLPGNAFDLTMHRSGRGRLYYAVGLSYVEDETAVPVVARGIEIRRDLRLADKATAIRAGDVLAIDLTLRNATPLRYVAVTTPLPAGVDAIDLDLAKQAAALPLKGQQCWWFNHKELHPERAVFFADTLPAGEHHHTIILRALSPGRFAMPAAHVEAMYEPEVNGRTASTMMEISAGRE